jgi:hypothetical protein
MDENLKNSLTQDLLKILKNPLTYTFYYSSSMLIYWLFHYFIQSLSWARLTVNLTLIVYQVPSSIQHVVHHS